MVHAQPDEFRSSPGGGSGPCFMSGTRIAAPEGAVCVEDLTVGSLVLTASGESRPVRWLGTRRLNCARYPNPEVVWPICIQAGAFADNQPSRDLWVSPGHSILVDGVLIPAQKLLNGVTIVQVPRDRVEYWHVELDSHDILLSEGLASESYLDTGNRTAFVNGGAFLEAYPDFQPKHWLDTCVPLILEGSAVEQAKRALLARAQALGHVTTEESDVHVVVDGKRIEPLRVNPTRMEFLLPAGSHIELRTRSFVPAHMNPASDDQRSLGLCINHWQVNSDVMALQDQTHFDAGWHGLESAPDGQQWRWSKERIPLPAQTRLLVIGICGRGCYWAESANAAAQRSLA